MLNDASGFENVYIACGYTDLRYGIDGLSTLIKHRFNLNPFSPRTLFMFCGRRSDRIKCLLWEGDGFLLLYKKLENGKFQWPRNSNEVNKLSDRQYRWLMEGLTIQPKNTVKTVCPKNTL